MKAKNVSRKEKEKLLGNIVLKDDVENLEVSSACDCNCMPD
jgi:hypothetical protein